MKTLIRIRKTLEVMSTLSAFERLERHKSVKNSLPSSADRYNSSTAPKTTALLTKANVAAHPNYQTLIKIDIKGFKQSKSSRPFFKRTKKHHLVFRKYKYP